MAFKTKASGHDQRSVRNEEKRSYEPSGLDLQELLEQGVKLGVRAITKQYSVFRGFETKLLNYVDSDAVYEFALERLKDLDFSNLKNAQDHVNDVRGEIARKIQSGYFLDNRGKEFVLRTSLKNQRGYFGSNNDLGKIFDTFHELHELALSSDYTPRELQGHLAKMQDLNYAHVAANILYSEKLLNRDDYERITKNVGVSARGTYKSLKESLEKIASPEQKIAAAVIGLIGVIVFFVSSSSITGNITGFRFITNLPVVIFSIFSIIFSIYLFYVIYKENFVKFSKRKK
jgi:hypothetical protein